jgi:hypothetical protein
MKLSLKLLQDPASLNNYSPAVQASIIKGQTANLYVQLVDSDTGNRYVPAAGSTLKISISRLITYLATLANERTAADYSVEAFATNPFADDRSIFLLPLTAAQTLNMSSGGIRAVLTQGSDVKIAVLNQAIVATTGVE